MKTKRIVRFCISILFAAISEYAASNPSGGTVVPGSGNATISTNPSNPNHLIINQDTTKAIINWDNFSISSKEITQFIQPNASSITLNRVIGPEASHIDGILKANGNVWILNANGIEFGSNARVDVAGLLATTANIKDQDFMNSHYHFVQEAIRNSAVTVKEGAEIRVRDTGMVALVAPAVSNRGVIVANLGKVYLGSGLEYTVDLYGDNLIHFAVAKENTNEEPQVLKAPDGEILNDAVHNGGHIIANGGKVVLSTQAAKRVVEHVINMDGVIEANTAIVKGKAEHGEVLLQGGKQGKVLVNGKISSSGRDADAPGGTVKVLGEKVTIDKKAEIDISGNAADVHGQGGGKIFIGGSRQGKDKSINSSEYTAVEIGAKLLADAITRGRGGEIVVWSDNYARCYGEISARGGSEGGAGGFVETSGVGGRATNGGIDLGSRITGLAPFYRRTNLGAQEGFSGGEWLLDPDTVTISINPTSGGVFGAPPQTWVPAVDNSNVVTADIVGFLQGGMNVTINVHDAVNGNILVNDPIVAFVIGAPALTFNTGTTGGVFTANANITSTGFPLSININAGAGVNINSTINTNGGPFFATLLGPSGSSPTMTVSGTINTATTTVILDAGNFGLMNITGTVNGNGVSINSPSQLLQLGGQITNLFTSRTISIGGDISTPGINLIGNGSITAVGLDLEVPVDGGNNLTFNSGSGNTTLNGVIGGNTPLAAFSASGGSITANQNISASSISLSAPTTLGADVNFTATNQTYNSTVNGAHNLTLTGAAGGTIAFNANVGGTTPLTSITVNNATGSSNGNFVVNNNAVITTGKFTQNSGTTPLTGNTAFGNSIVSSTALTIVTGNLTGSITAPFLTLTANSCNITGTIGGFTTEQVSGTFPILLTTPTTLALATANPQSFLFGGSPIVFGSTPSSGGGSTTGGRAGAATSVAVTQAIQGLISALSSITAGLGGGGGANQATILGFGGTSSGGGAAGGTVTVQSGGTSGTSTSGGGGTAPSSGGGTTQPSSTTQPSTTGGGAAATTGGGTASTSTTTTTSPAATTTTAPTAEAPATGAATGAPAAGAAAPTTAAAGPQATTAAMGAPSAPGVSAGTAVPAAPTAANAPLKPEQTANWSPGSLGRDTSGATPRDIQSVPNNNLSPFGSARPEGTYVPGAAEAQNASFVGAAVQTAPVGYADYVNRTPVSTTPMTYSDMNNLLGTAVNADVKNLAVPISSPPAATTSDTWATLPSAGHAAPQLLNASQVEGFNGGAQPATVAPDYSQALGRSQDTTGIFLPDIKPGQNPVVPVESSTLDSYIRLQR